VEESVPLAGGGTTTEPRRTRVSWYYEVKVDVAIIRDKGCVGGTG